MYLNSTKLLMTNTMMIGVIMTICSNSWISMWMGLEMSMLSFIPLMSNKNNLSSESLIKYFIMQSVASTMFLFSVIIMLVGVNMKNEMIMTTSMLIKLGSAPFHNWVIMIIEPMSYTSMMILLTVLKAPPLSILYQINTNMILIPIYMGMIVSAIMCLNQSSIKKIIGYSSIYNISLMMITINKINITLTFLIIYSTMLMLIIYFLKSLKLNFINQINISKYNFWIKMNLWINMLSMGGFPPLNGFILKMMVIQMLIFSDGLFLLLILMLTSMLVMMFYMRLAYTSMISNTSSFKWMKNDTKTNYFSMIINLMLTPFMMSISSIS
uniref:NADH-ubiquinone oxidoreductase chain 2 n=1 Tax=Paramacrosteles nigromaculatus TaxID=2665880 RepID=A0A5Q2N1C5_9HEMI|nr:NADH dehydrogenase subunit 2 [Paramacrosteles nigromaculatus]QGG46180.1 NADH dehydrogenase subunit 2 [Paramacrosteles nigromaculatus]